MNLSVLLQTDPIMRMSSSDDYANTSSSGLSVSAIIESPFLGSYPESIGARPDITTKKTIKSLLFRGIMLVMIHRAAYLQTIQIALDRSRVVALIGPRQSGKTTLARQFVSPDFPNYFDLEDLTSLARLQEPMTALRELHGVVVIDEIQRRPDLFPLLRVLADRDHLPARFLILGSASPDVVRASSELLAGRIEVINVSGFSISEVGVGAQAVHWLRGGFPLSFLANSEADSLAWRKHFIQMLLERDFPQWGIRIPAATLLRFWTMLAHYHGQIWNNAEPARSLGVSEPTVRNYLDILEGVFMVQVLQPWHANLSKKASESPQDLFSRYRLASLFAGDSFRTGFASTP